MLFCLVYAKKLSKENDIARAVKHEKIERKVIYPKIFNAEYEFLGNQIIAITL